MERILIKNFGGLKNSEIELNKINIFIGKQASGKSVTAKLIYFFRGIIPGIFDEIVNIHSSKIKSKENVTESFLKKFTNYFPAESHPDASFEIAYYFNDNEFIKVLTNKKRKIKIEYSKEVENLFNEVKEIYLETRQKLPSVDKEDATFGILFRYDSIMRDRFIKFVRSNIGTKASPARYNLFVPAGRSFFANLEDSIFALLDKLSIDPFLIEFGSAYQKFKNSRPLGLSFDNEKLDSPVGILVENLTEELLNSKYKRERGKDYLIHFDNRKVSLAFASSGQQEILPLILTLKHLLWRGNSTTFIEEPEAHLFPGAQKRIVELIGAIFNNNPRKSDLQFIITTHSPYILSAFNNLVQASIVYNGLSSDKAKSKVNKIIPKELHIKPGYLSAYAFKEGSAESIIDPETQLIYGEYLDSVSEEIGSEFASLLDLT